MFSLEFRNCLDHFFVFCLELRYPPAADKLCVNLWQTVVLV